MTSALAWSVALFGVEGTPVTISAQIGTVAPPSVPRRDDQPVNRETVERARAAVRNSGLPWPTEIVIVTASSQLPGNPSLLDLAVACAVLAADDQLPADEMARTVFVGGLGLDGSIRAVHGVLPALLAARRVGIDRAIVPASNLPEAALVAGLGVFGANKLADVAAEFRGDRGHLASPTKRTLVTDPAVGTTSCTASDAEVDAPELPSQAGQPEAVRAVEVAAAGGHHLLLVGRPGTGRSLHARLLHHLRPALTDDEALEVTAIHSVAGRLQPGAPLVTTAPFITPHCSMSLPALVGGGTGLAKPGAISHAHRGILFLDEACEFAPDRLEALRTALEEGEIRLARRDGVVRYPAQFQLVLATTLCPCGQSEQDCGCSPQARRRFLARITGPLLDRVDVRVRLNTPDSSVPGFPTAEDGAILRARVHAARSRAAQRWAAHGGSVNADVPASTFTNAEFRLARRVTAPLDRALEIGALSARGGVRTLRVAWTLADLAGLIRPGRDEITEALDFRDRRSS